MLLNTLDCIKSDHNARAGPHALCAERSIYSVFTPIITPEPSLAPLYQNHVVGPDIKSSLIVLSGQICVVGSRTVIIGVVYRKVRQKIIPIFLIVQKQYQINK